MKLFFHTLVVAAIFCLAATSCTPENKTTDPRDPVVFRNASATYYGATENSSAYFAMDLTDGGKKLHLEFYGDPVGDRDTPTLKICEYSIAAGSEAQAGSFIPGSGDDGSVYSEIVGKRASLYEIKGGMFSISLSGTSYKITVGLKDQNGDEIPGSYTGPITLKDTRKIIPNDFTLGFSSFYGREVNDGAHLFWVGLNSDGIVWDSSKEAYTGNGCYVRLSIMTGTDAYAGIPDGTYTLAESAAPGSVLINKDNTYYAEVSGDATTVKPLTAGTVTFKRTGDVYDIVMDITDSDGNNYRKTYQGELESNNLSHGFLEDTDLGAFASGQMSYYGKTDKNAYNFLIVLFDSGVGMDAEGSLTGSGSVMVMDMYSETGSKTDITPTTYSVTDTSAPGTVLQWYTLMLWDAGSYIYEVENGEVINSVYIEGGTVTLSGANPEYGIQTAFKCHNGFNIASTYSGSLEYFDESSDNIIFPKTSPADRYQFASLKVQNWGDDYGTGTTLLDFVLASSEMELNMEILTTDIGGSLIAPAGTYTFADTHLANTFSEYSFIRYKEANFLIKGGTMTITDLNDAGDRSYAFDFDMGEKSIFYSEYKSSPSASRNYVESPSARIPAEKMIGRRDKAKHGAHKTEPGKMFPEKAVQKSAAGYAK